MLTGDFLELADPNRQPDFPPDTTLARPDRCRRTAGEAPAPPLVLGVFGGGPVHSYQAKLVGTTRVLPAVVRVETIGQRPASNCGPLTAGL